MQFTYLDRMYWPELRATKGDLVEYYEQLAPVLVPHLEDRPFTLKQHYTVPRGPFRYVKDAPPELPAVVRRCPQPAKSRRGGIVNYATVDNRTSLLWMVELGAVDLHVWPSRCDRPANPDYVLFDIDADRTSDAVDAAALGGVDAGARSARAQPPDRSGPGRRGRRPPRTAPPRPPIT